MASILQSFKAPIREKLIDSNGNLTRPWERFFLDLQEVVYPLGQERAFTLVNNQSTAADITNLSFSSSGTTFAIVDYLIQRVTTSTGAVELTEGGIFGCAYNPTSETWSLFVISENNPDNANVAFSITSTGQVQYTTSNEGGTASISTVWHRARIISGKNSLYSRANR